MAKMTGEARTKAIAKAVKMRADGAKWPEVLKATGLTHVAAEYGVLNATEKRRIAFTPENVVMLRDKEGRSWGYITVVTGQGSSESKVRNTYRDAANVESQGLRVGKGGRFYRRDQLLYDGELKPTGTSIPKGEKPVARQHALKQRILTLVKADPQAAQRIAAKYGITIPASAKTPAQVTEAIFKASEAKKVTAPKAKKAQKAAKAPAQA